MYQSINKFNNLENAHRNKEMSYIPVRAWQDGKVEHITASTRNATTTEHTIVDRVVVLLVSPMRTKIFLLPSYIHARFCLANKRIRFLLFIREAQ